MDALFFVETAFTNPPIEAIAYVRGTTARMGSDRQ